MLQGPSFRVADPDGSYIWIYDQVPGNGVVIAMQPTALPGHTITPGYLSMDSIAAPVETRVVLAGPGLDGANGPQIEFSNFAAGSVIGSDSDELALDTVGSGGIVAAVHAAAGIVELIADDHVEITGPGWAINSVDQPNGPACRLTSNANSAAIGAAETAVLTTAGNITWVAGRAYRARLFGGWIGSGGGADGEFRLRLTNAAGTYLGTWYRTPAYVAGSVQGMVGGAVYFRNSGGADVNAPLCLTLQRIGGGAVTVAAFGNATNPWGVVVDDVGTATQYAFANSV